MTSSRLALMNGTKGAYGRLQTNKQHCRMENMPTGCFCFFWTQSFELKLLVQKFESYYFGRVAKEKRQATNVRKKLLFALWGMSVGSTIFVRLKKFLT